MKTSVIRYRVADFLRESPPFDSFSLADLLVFSGTGRVIFHEDDIYLFRKGQAREPLLWVIQQGKVEILDEAPTGAQLQDVLGPGDILGLGPLPPAGAYPHAARTATEVILYSFDLGAFETLVSRYPGAARFLTAHLSATARQTKALQAPAQKQRLLTEREKAVWLNAAYLPAALISQWGATCGPELPVGEAVERMTQAQSEAIAVVAAEGHPLGLMAKRELCEQVATGAIPADAPAEVFMHRRFPTAPPGLRTADYLLAMLRGRCQWLAITDDGSAGSPLQGIVSDSDLAVNCGRNPTLLMRGMLAARTDDELAYLRRQGGVFLAEGLVGPSVVEWCSQMAGELDAALAEGAVRLAVAEMTRDGSPHPGLPSCWLFFGRAGRQEVLTPTAPDLGVVYADPPRGEEGEAGEYFGALARQVAAKLQACGLGARQSPSRVSQDITCRTLSGWKEFYAGLIRDPIGNAVYAARAYFDFHVVSGDASLGAELKRMILAELESDQAFIPVLANDTLANLPPLTFYQGSVIETDGTPARTLDVEKTALDPIVDAARVWAFAGREVSGSNTLQRLGFSAGVTPQYASVLNDAAEGWRIVAYHHALAGLSDQDGGTVIQPWRLSRFEERLLKTAFDATRRLLALTSSIYNSTVSP